MKEKEIRYNHIQYVDALGVILGFLENNPAVILLLYDTTRQAFIFNSTNEVLIELLKIMLPTINPQIKFFIFNNQESGFSKIDINLKKCDDNHYRGKMFGIPDCCIKAYIRDEGKKLTRTGHASFNAAIRYYKQLKKEGITDKFNVIMHDGFVDCKFGFIPCHPHCKKALKIVDKYHKICENFDKYQNANI